MSTPVPGYTSGRSVTPRRVLSQAGRDHHAVYGVIVSGSASIDQGNTSYTKYLRGGAFLAYNSGVYAPVKRTKANGSGSSSTSLTVDSAIHFQAGDSVIVGDNTAQAIVSVSGSVITLTSAITWTDNCPVYVDAYKTAVGILVDDEVNLWNADKSANVNATAVMVARGLVNYSALLGDITAILEDPQSAENLKAIQYEQAVLGQQSLPSPGPDGRQWRKRMLSGNITLVAADSGTEFYATAAATVTLPSLATAGEGFRVRVHQTADANLTVSAPSGKMIALNNATATSVACSTSSQKIGAGFEVALLPDATKYFAANISAGANTVTVS